MSLNVHIGTFNTPTSLSSVDVTGLGFTPKLVFFLGNGATATGGSALKYSGIGAFASPDGSTITQGAAGVIKPDVASNAGAVHSGVHCGILPTGSTGIRYSFACTAVGSGQFTLDHDDIDASARIVRFLALGGDDLENCKVVKHTVKSSTGSQAYTGAGFQPDAVIAFNCGINTADEVLGTTPRFSVGVTDGTTTYQNSHADDSGTGSGGTRAITTDLVVIGNSNATSELCSATLTSLDADGCTLNWNVVNGTQYPFYLVYVKGPRFKVLTETQKTSTGTKSKTGTGFIPVAMLFGGNTHTATGYQVDTYGFNGFAGNGSNAYNWGGMLNGTRTHASKWDSGTACVGAFTTNVSAAPTKVAEASLSTFDSNGFTLNWGTADGTARLFWTLSIAPKKFNFVPAFATGCGWH